jgi:hypothetical protein
VGTVAGPAGGGACLAGGVADLPKSENSLFSMSVNEIPGSGRRLSTRLLWFLTLGLRVLTAGAVVRHAIMHSACSSNQSFTSGPGWPQGFSQEKLIWVKKVMPLESVWRGSGNAGLMLSGNSYILRGYLMWVLWVFLCASCCRIHATLLSFRFAIPEKVL